MSTETIFHKIERPAFDEMLTFGSKEFLADLPNRTVDELRLAEQRLRAIREQKTENTYFVFPVSQPKQLAAGKLYFGAMAAVTRAIRSELAKRAAVSLFVKAEGVAA